jgi:hypothetical protein
MPRVDFAVDATLHDLQLTADGRDVVLWEDADDEPQIIAEDAAQVLSANEGEWAWDIGFGLPLFDLFFKAGTSRQTCEGVIRAKLLERPGVESVPDMSLTQNMTTRRLSGWISVRYTTGTLDRITL